MHCNISRYKINVRYKYKNSKNMSKIEENTIPVIEFSFLKGWNQLRQMDVDAVKEEIMNALGITTAPNFYRRLRGEVEPRVTEHQAIENVFKKYGITEIWGVE